MSAADHDGLNQLKANELIKNYYMKKRKNTQCSLSFSHVGFKLLNSVFIWTWILPVVSPKELNSQGIQINYPQTGRLARQSIWS